FGPDRTPSAPIDIPVFTVSGLDDFKLPKPMDLHVKTANDASPLGTGSQYGFFFGNDFRAAYAYGVDLNGAGQSVGIVAFDGYFSNDIVTFKNWAGSSDVLVTNVLLDGFNGSPGIHVDETSLDIEMAI